MTEPQRELNDAHDLSELSAAEPEAVLKLKAFIALWKPRLIAIIEEHNASLPEQAAQWPLAAVYIRESYGRSLVGESPDVQLRVVLELMAQRQLRVSAATLFFEVESATMIATRGEFKRLLELAMAGGVKVIGMFMTDRLFRNVEESTRTKNEFRPRGIELLYMGKFEGDHRTPSAWHLETMQDVANELHARNRTLRDPRFAGYHRPTEYMGFKPGVYSPARPKRTADSELVPAVTPALWTLDEHRQIVELCRKRARGAKVRLAYVRYLLAGIAIDGRCGHPMQLRWRKDTRYSMRCGVVEIDGHLHGLGHRADLAALELDELIGEVTFDDAGFLRQVEEELHHLSLEEQGARDRFVPDPAIGVVRQALVALSGFASAEVRASLDVQLVELEAADVRRRDALATPVAEFRRAMEAIESWKVVWSEADVQTKNQLLRDFGLRVTLAQLPADEGKRARPFWIREMAAENPVFELALAVALRARNERLVAHQTRYATNDPIRLSVPPLAGLLNGFMGADANSVAILRNPLGATRQPVALQGDWLTIAEFAARCNVRTGVVLRWLRAGRLANVHRLNFSRGSFLISASELPPMRRGRRWRVDGADSLMSPRESGELAAWVTGRVEATKRTRRELAAETGLSVLTIRAIQVGRSQPDLRSATRLAAYFDRVEPSEESHRFRQLCWGAAEEPDAKAA